MDEPTYRRVMLRVVAPLTGLIILSSLDRVNVSFAALRMNADLGLDPKAYGFGVGIFFVGYLLFQLPSAAVLRRIGPRRWIAASVTGWGVVATAMALIETPLHFYVLRFLLGLFESGFAPGVVWGFLGAIKVISPPGTPVLLGATAAVFGAMTTAGSDGGMVFTLVTIAGLFGAAAVRRDLLLMGLGAVASLPVLRLSASISSSARLRISIS